MTREEAIKTLANATIEPPWGGSFSATSEAIGMAIEALSIVCCGECEHGIVETGSRFPFEGNVTCELDRVKRQWFKNDFCSYGERREANG